MKLSQYKLSDKYGQSGGILIDHDNESPDAHIKWLLDRYHDRLLCIVYDGVLVFEKGSNDDA